MLMLRQVYTTKVFLSLILELHIIKNIKCWTSFKGYLNSVDVEQIFKKVVRSAAFMLIFSFLLQKNNEPSGVVNKYHS